MKIDIHAHLFYDTHQQDQKDLLRACKQYQIQRVYVSTLGEFYPTPEQIKDYNQMTHRFIQDHPQQVGGFVTLDPVHKNWKEVLEKGVIDQQMEGVKIWVSCFCDDERVDPIAQKCEQHHVPLLIHSYHKAVGQLPFETTGVHVRNLAKRHPHCKIIMAHMGGNAYHGLPCVDDLPNVYVDISGSACTNDEIGYAVKKIGHERILFGTDMPIGVLPAISRVEEAGLTPQQKQAIYRDNASRWLERKAI